MADKYYSLQQAADKLGKSTADVEKLIKEGKLRQFTDAKGPVVPASQVDAMAGPDMPEGSSIGLTPLDDSRMPSATPAAPASPIFDLGSDEFDLSAEDTQLTGKGVDILGEADNAEFKITDDTMGKTAMPAASGQGQEPSLEKIENDVNLDSFGSGSGLLDLSLQADDTSLGGVLDEIYPGADLPASPDVSPAGSGTPQGPVAVAEEAEQIFTQPEGTVTTAAMVTAYMEPEADMASNVMGIAMFVPLFAAIYCLIVMAGATVGTVPTIAMSVQDIIWYIMGGAGAVAVIVMVIGMAMGSKK